MCTLFLCLFVRVHFCCIAETADFIFESTAFNYLFSFTDPKRVTQETRCLFCFNEFLLHIHLHYISSRLADMRGWYRSEVKQRKNYMPCTRVIYPGLVAGTQSTDKLEYSCCFSLCQRTNMNFEPCFSSPEPLIQ